MFKRLGSLRSRLLLGSVIPAVLFLGVSLVAFLTIMSLLRTLDLERQSNRVLTKAQDVRATQLRMEAAKRGYYLVEQPDLRTKLERVFHEQWTKHERDLAQLAQLVAGNRHQRDRVEELTAITHRWHETALSDIALFAAGTPMETEVWRATIRRLHLPLTIHLSEEISSRIKQVIDDETRTLEVHHEDAQAASRDSILAIGLTLAGVVVLAVFIPLKISQSITSNLVKLQEATDQLLRGGFAPLRPEGPAEIARLMSNFNAMGLALVEREMVLRTSERRYQGLVGSMTHLLWTYDAQGKLVEYAGWQAFAGLSDEDGRGGTILASIHPEDRERAELRWTEARTSQAPYEDEFRIRRHDGVYRFVSCRCVPIFSSKGMLQEWVCAAVDITERRQEEELWRQVEAAEAANRAKTAFLTKMSHELRTPLNAIIGMSKMLTSRRFGELTAKQGDYLADITQAGEHLLRLINDVLDLAKVEAGRLEVHTEPVEVGAALTAVLSPLRTLAESKKLNLILHPPEPDGFIHSDPDRFKQVLYNLVSNAIKFTPARGQIVVRAMWVDGVTAVASPCDYQHALGLRLEVEDTGVGIPAEELDSIWEEFRQASNRGKSEGSGLGLALVRRLAVLLDGEVGVRSQRGHGSCFWIVLPRNPAETLSSREASTSALTA